MLPVAPGAGKAHLPEGRSAAFFDQCGSTPRAPLASPRRPHATWALTIPILAQTTRLACTDAAPGVLRRYRRIRQTPDAVRIVGTRQNEPGQDSCTDADPGYYVGSTSSTSRGTECGRGDPAGPVPGRTPAWMPIRATSWKMTVGLRSIRIHKKWLLGKAIVCYPRQWLR